jgi:hypothetical protein
MLCKICDFRGGHYEECRLLGYKNPVPTSQERHYVSATEHSRYMLRFEIFAAVTMKNAVFWDKWTQSVPHRRHYISATESNQLLLCKILGFRGGNYEECRRMGYKALRLL